MPEKETDELYEQMQKRTGAPIAEGSAAVDPVNMPMIRRWTDAFGDRNPVYEDRAAAATTRHKDIIAPPAMMPIWAMPRPVLDNLAERGGLTADIDPDSPLLAFDKAGYFGSLATDSALEFERPLRLGDVLTSEAILESVSPRKKTALGLGYFITWVTNYTDQNGEAVGRQRFTLFKFDPSTMGA